jgi:hypothetical protein
MHFIRHSNILNGACYYCGIPAHSLRNFSPNWYVALAIVIIAVEQTLVAQNIFILLSLPSVWVSGYKNLFLREITSCRSRGSSV